jgi:Kef-type K+ transport system membrane component KefB/mannitol/fructose-specific phosphotransferase system IIA component
MHVDPLLLLATVVLVGLGVGTLARRVGLPGVSGQILAGLAIGHAGLGLFDEQDVRGLQPVTHLALALITLVVGGHLNVRRLRNAGSRLGWLVLAEVLVIPTFVTLLVAGPGGQPWPLALLMGTVAISTAPATTVALVTETRAKGVFVKTLLAAVALNNVACILLFELAHTIVLDHGAGAMLVQPLRQLLLSGGVGALTGAVLVLLTRHVVRARGLTTASLISVLVASGLASSLGVSPLLACLALGATLANLTPDKDEIVESTFINLRDALFAVFFTLAGMELRVEHVLDAGLVVLLIVAGRAAGKLLAASVALRLAGATDKVRRWLGPALLPQAGVAVGLLLFAQELPDVGAWVLSVGLATVVLNELIGPPLARLALLRSGEAGADRERLIDFLAEENIVTDLAAGSKEEAIEQLVDVAIRTNRLDADRDVLLAAVLQRERETSTCFGSGLAVPHAAFDGIDRIVGAMGISRDGLRIDTPDGEPVHCMIVLFTPPDERERHLQVLAALARSIGADRLVQRQLSTPPRRPTRMRSCTPRRPRTSTTTSSTEPRVPRAGRGLAAVPPRPFAAARSRRPGRGGPRAAAGRAAVRYTPPHVVAPERALARRAVRGRPHADPGGPDPHRRRDAGRPRARRVRGPGSHDALRAGRRDALRGGPAARAGHAGARRHRRRALVPGASDGPGEARRAPGPGRGPARTPRPRRRRHPRQRPNACGPLRRHRCGRAGQPARRRAARQARPPGRAGARRLRRVPDPGRLRGRLRHGPRRAPSQPAGHPRAAGCARAFGGGGLSGRSGAAGTPAVQGAWVTARSALLPVATPSRAFDWNQAWK